MATDTKPKVVKQEEFRLIYKQKTRRGQAKKYPVIQIVVDHEEVVINLTNKPIVSKSFDYLKDNTLPVASQEELKMLYDKSSAFKKYVKAPLGYKAPWDVTSAN